MVRCIFCRRRGLADKEGGIAADRLARRAETPISPPESPLLVLAVKPAEDHLIPACRQAMPLACPRPPTAAQPRPRRARRPAGAAAAPPGRWRRGPRPRCDSRSPGQAGHGLIRQVSGQHHDLAHRLVQRRQAPGVGVRAKPLGTYCPHVTPMQHRHRKDRRGWVGVARGCAVALCQSSPASGRFRPRLLRPASEACFLSLTGSFAICLGSARVVRNLEVCLLQDPGIHGLVTDPRTKR